MINLASIKAFYPAPLSTGAVFHKHLLKEYVQLLVLDYLSATPYARKLTFIGETNLRLVKGIDRFSEDLDFDCKALTEEEFMRLSNDVIAFLLRSGFKVEARDRASGRLSAYRRNIHFPGLLFDMGLSGHREERFLLKLEAQDQGIAYERAMGTIKGCGLFFTFPVPPDPVLCAMKISALLARSKGRDFYDAMFLLSQTAPDYAFLAARCGVRNLRQLKSAVAKMLDTIDLQQKQKDFEHLVFNRDNSKRILRFREFIRSLTE